MQRRVRGAGVAAVSLLIGVAMGCGDPSPEGSETGASTERGAVLYAEHCADCHGADGRGGGPIAPGLTSTPADLTHIAARRGGEFSAAEIRRMVDGRSDFQGHRDIEMPLWGDFFEEDPDAKIESLVRYLESIQRSGDAAAGSPSASQASASTTGEELFVRYCAACHGARGKGDGPVAASLATPPADLTLLAKDTGGQFDASAVMATIDGRREVAAHGPREMPVWGAVFASDHAGAGARHAAQLSVLLTKLLTDHVASLQI